MNEKASILIVDDDKLLLDMYSLKFKEHGFDVKTSPDGENALTLLRDKFAPSAIVFDVVMPGLDGFEFLKTVRGESLAPGTVFIALSNQGQDSDIAKAKELGVDGYIVKASAYPTEIVNKILDIISKKQA
jgi:DNA-binding response OmpR family regulator